jgi:DUF2975 family protein
MKSKTQALLLTLNVLAWLAFFGFIIKGGAILVSYGVSVRNPVGAKNLYMGWDLSALREYDFWHYSGVVYMRVLLLFLQAYIAFLVTKVLSKIKLANPFSIEVSNLMERISYFMLATWVVVMLHNSHIGWLAKTLPSMQENYISGEFIFLAGVVFVIAQVFKKGVEIQTENELTV